MDRLSVVSHSRFAFRIVTHSNRFSDYSKHERVLCFSHIQIFIESTNQSVVKASRKSVCFLCLKIWFKLAYQYVRLIDFSHLQSVRAHGYALTIQLLTEFIKKNVKKKSQFSTSDLSVILSLSHSFGFCVRQINNVSVTIVVFSGKYSAIYWFNCKHTWNELSICLILEYILSSTSIPIQIYLPNSCRNHFWCEIF